MSETIVENLVPKAGAVSAFWETFCRAAGVPPHTPYQAWYFGDSPAMAHELVELVLNGPKRATASSGWMNDSPLNAWSFSTGPYMCVPQELHAWRWISAAGSTTASLSPFSSTAT